MRGRVDPQAEVYHIFILDDLVPANHPLRQVKTRAGRIIGEMSARFTGVYGKTGRRSVPPGQLIKALLLQAVCGIRSEIQPCEQIGYNMLFRWFLDMTPSEKVWTPEVFGTVRFLHGLLRR